MWYILNEKNEPVPEPDCLVAAQFLESGNRIVAQSDVGDAHLSTVFLCLDHGMGRPGGPVLYESMWFGGPMDGDQRRYRTREEALAGHQEMLNEVARLRTYLKVAGYDVAEAIHEAAESIADKYIK